MVYQTLQRGQVQRRQVFQAEAGKSNLEGKARVGGTKPPLKGVSTHPRPIRAAKNKDSTSLDEILADVAGLTKAGRQQLLDQLALQTRLSATSVSNPDLELWTQAVDKHLGAAILSQGGESYGSVLVKRVVGAPAAWRPMEEFMASSGLQEFRRAERWGIYLLLAEMLVQHAERLSDRTDAPLSPKLVAQCAPNIAGIVERQFPGYQAAGMLPMVVRQLQRAPL